MLAELSLTTVEAIATGRHGDPFAVLGRHRLGPGAVAIRAFFPELTPDARVEVVSSDDDAPVTTLERIGNAGFYTATVGDAFADRPYHFRIADRGATRAEEDPYRFPPVLGELDRYLLAEGRDDELYRKLGAHPRTIDGVDGVAFAVWAPGAARVSVVGDFNGWDGRRHPMRRHPGPGIWELFLPGIPLGTLYKYELLAADFSLLPLHADPVGFAAERLPGTASIVVAPPWSARGERDESGAHERERRNARRAPIAIYEVHLGSWRRGDRNRYLSYRELAEALVDHAVGLGFTHLELLPIAEHPFDGSWGYQVTGLYAPTSRFGSPADFAYFVDRAHAAGLGVILDWVPGHFPADDYGLAQFDGTHLYDHADPRQGFQPDWNTLIYNFGRNEVQNFLVANALFWLKEYGIDGLRVDAVASMLYLDYSRREGEWVPNVHGGRENLAAIAFLQRTNATAYATVAGITTIAEESTAWPAVSAPVDHGGLGFGYKWNMGWMHDTLGYMRIDPLFRRYHQNELTFGFTYAFSENFVLPLSHDEVVYGKGSILGKMPGDRWQQFANLRAYYGFMYDHPGKKLLFMGCEFAQPGEWNHDRGLDWHVLENEDHAGVARLVHDLNHTYRGLPALHARDCERGGFEWIASDGSLGILAFARHGATWDDLAVVVCNFTPVVRERYRVGVPTGGTYLEAINTDAVRYGGSGAGNGPLLASDLGFHDKPHSIELTLPPLATLILKRT